MSTQPASHLPDLGKLSIAILEHLVGEVIGEDAVQVVKGPYLARQRREAIAEALANAERRFTVAYSDADLKQAILDLPLANLAAVQQAVIAFYERPTDPGLAQVLRTQLARDYGQVSETRIEAAVSTYLAMVREELIYVDEEYRQKISILAQLRTSDAAAAIARGVEQQSRLYRPPTEPGSAPPKPELIIGRDDDMRDLKMRLGLTTGQPPAEPQVLTAMRGWPGVGKTTLAATLAYDPEVLAAFPDGVLWTSLGTNPNLLGALAAWGRALGLDDLHRAQSIEEASARLAARLREQRRLLIVDDVWEPEHAVPFRVGGRNCAQLITTRVTSVADKLAPTPAHIYKLQVLSDAQALELLRRLAPIVVEQHPTEAADLVHELEGLPLAIQVAGRLLNAEAGYGFGVGELLSQLTEGTRLLEAVAPADRADVANETTPTVAVLLQKSTDRLDAAALESFAFLGAFVPKPATFDLAAMASVWEVDDPRPIVRTLVDHGLIEFVPETGRYQMHALLVTHARSFLDEDDEE